MKSRSIFKCHNWLCGFRKGLRPLEIKQQEDNPKSSACFVYVAIMNTLPYQTLLSVDTSMAYHTNVRIGGGFVFNGAVSRTEK